MHQCIKFILFQNDTLHVSDGLSVHRQEFKTVHNATGICQTDAAVCLLARWQQTAICCHLVPTSKQTAVSIWHMPVAVCTVLNSWWWTERCPKLVECHSEIKSVWYIGASCWFYYRNNIVMHGHANVKIILWCTAMRKSKLTYLLVEQSCSMVSHTTGLYCMYLS